MVGELAENNRNEFIYLHIFTYIFLKRMASRVYTLHLLTLERPAICPYLERPQWVIFDPCTKVH